MVNLDEEKAVFQSLLREAVHTGADLSGLIHAQKARLVAAGLPDGEINHLIHDRHGRAAYRPQWAVQETVLHVPLADIDRARVLGARRHLANNVWVAPAGADLNRFRRWLR